MLQFKIFYMYVHSCCWGLGVFFVTRNNVKVRVRVKYFVSVMMSLSGRISFESLINYFSEVVAAEI